MKKGDKVIYVGKKEEKYVLGNYVDSFKKGQYYTIDSVVHPINCETQIFLKETRKYPIGYYVHLFRKVNGLDRAIQKLVKYKWASTRVNTG